MLKESLLTIAPVAACDNMSTSAEWGRLRDLERLFGLRRGTVYTLLRDGKIKGCLLRIRGQQSGVRLIHLQSVRDYINTQMQESHQAEAAR